MAVLRLLGSLGLLLLLLLAALASEPDLDRLPDETGWIDPFDMGLKPSKKEKAPPPSDDGRPLPGLASQATSHLRRGQGHRVNPPSPSAASDDAASGTRSIPSRLAEISSCSQTESQLRQCRQELRQQVNMDTLDDSDKPAEAEAPAIPAEDKYLQRHLRFLLNHFQLEADHTPQPDQPREFRVLARFSRDDVTRVRAYLDDPRAQKLADVDAVLSRFLAKVEPLDDEDDGGDVSAVSYFETTFFGRVLPEGQQDLLWLALILLPLSFCLVLLFWRLPSVTTILALFVLSVVWHWMHLYKKALSKKHAALVHSQSVPPECAPADQMTWLPYLYHLVSPSSSKQTCAAYHEALLVDPLWEISPTVAVAETLTVFLIWPLEHLGDSLGKFFAALLAQLSWLSAPVVLAFACMLLVLLLFLLFGYRLRLPFFLGVLEPSSVGSDSKVESKLLLKVDQLQQVVDQLEREKQDMAALHRHQRLALTATIEKRSTRQLDNVVPTRLCQAMPVRVDDVTDMNAAAPVSCDNDPSMQTRSSPVKMQGYSQKPKEDLAEKSVCPFGMPQKANQNSAKPLAVAAKEDLPKMATTPVKKLVAVGSLTSPKDTEFEWVEEGEEEERLVQMVADDADADEVIAYLANPVRKLDFDDVDELEEQIVTNAIMEKMTSPQQTKEFLERVQEVFQDDLA